MTVRDYSTTAGDNTTIAGISLADTMLANALDNAIRAAMADTGNFLLDIAKPTSTTGSANAYLLTTGGTVGAYADKVRLAIRPNFSNTGACTINVDSVGVVDLKVYTSAGVANPTAGQIQSGGVYDILYVVALGDFVVLNPTESLVITATSGTIDGAVVGGVTPAAVTATTLNATGGGALTGTWTDLGSVSTVDINGGTIDGTTIGATTPAAVTTSSLVATTADINGGTIDGTVIGGATPAAADFTTIDSTGLATLAALTVVDANGNVTLDSGTGEAHSITLSHKGSYAEVNAIEFTQGSTSYGNNQIKFLNMNSAGAVVETARIDGGGNVLVAGFSTTGATAGQKIDGLNAITSSSVNTTASYKQYKFYNPNGEVGSISTNGTATAYNTSSDYRLKKDILPIVDASARVLALNPINFAWKVDNTRVDGFLAHELGAAIAGSATGSKDAMKDEEYEVTPAVNEDVVITAGKDADGVTTPARTEQRQITAAVMGTRSVPDMQGIDQSKVVPLLTAALQEALTAIADLKARVAVLETPAP